MATFLSKSKLMAYRQCPRRLWLDLHEPERREDSSGSAGRVDAGLAVGTIARRLYDPLARGVLIDIEQLGLARACKATEEALRERRPIFEATFASDGALALADILLPIEDGSWHMVEVKSSTSIKEVYREDLAIQAYVARQSGLNLSGLSLALVDSSWIYPGDGDYRGLLSRVDLTEETLQRCGEVPRWITEAQEVACADSLPDTQTGRQCDAPYPCPFFGYCRSLEPTVDYPLEWLPRFPAQRWIDRGVTDLRDLPEEVLNDRQRLVRDCTLNQRVFFDRLGAEADLAPYPLPALFLDFETIQFAVPIWAGTRPYQHIPFQYSLHRLDRHGRLEHLEFLDLSGQDPSRGFAEQLIHDAGSSEPIFVYNASFERSRMMELGRRFPDLSGAMHAIIDRVVDLLPIARNRYYHPSQHGSWSIKAVLPAAVPELSYQDLEGVQDGGAAQESFLEAIDTNTSTERKDQLRQQLLAYCRLDTYAMVRLWEVFSGYIRPLDDFIE
ncbi:DUF2779 domain-containing protein [Acidithiobacillus caldus]|nr:DUF2779 domain-containing protein [Acidithiobacillus caldus]